MASVTSAPSDEPPSPVNSASGLVRYFFVDVRFQFLDQKLAVETGQPTAAFFPLRLGVDHGPCRRVFMDPLFAHVGDGHDDERLDQSFLTQSLGGFVHAPFHTAECSRSIENILAIVHVQHRITFPGKSPVTRRQIHQNIPPIPENPGWKSAVPFNVSSESVFRHGRARRIADDIDVVQMRLPPQSL